jgi:DNA-binding NtrC family response regulator
VRYDWPGNVRELESVIERALVLGDADAIAPEDLPSVIGAATPAPGGLRLEIPEEGIDLEAVERTLIEKALARTGGNVSRAARLLGLSRRTLQYRLEKISSEPDGAPTAPDGAPATGRPVRTIL